MIVKIYHYEVSFSKMVKTEAGYTVASTQETIVVEDTRKLTPLTIHNLVRKAYAKTQGEDPGYIVIPEIIETVVNKEYEEVK